jgi:hypothetical protein
MTSSDRLPSSFSGGDAGPSSGCSAALSYVPNGKLEVGIGSGKAQSILDCEAVVERGLPFGVTHDDNTSRQRNHARSVT